MQLTTEDRDAIEALLARRTRLMLRLAPIFVAFNAVDWIVYPECAADWLVFRLLVFAVVLGLHLGIARKMERAGFVVVIVYAAAFSLPISLMTFQSGGFDSSYYVGVLTLASAVFVLFPMPAQRGIGTMALIVGPYLALGFLHGDVEVRRLGNNIAFLVSIGTFLVLGAHLSTVLFVGQHRARRELEVLFRTVEESARRDPLTGLYNRRHLDRCLREAFARWDAQGEPFCLLIADVDHFKALNDTWGHQAGDLGLVKVGEALQRATRSEDVVARYGGEEFAILLPDTSKAGARVVGERLRETVEGLSVVWEGVRLPLRVSIGLAEVRAGEDEAALVRRADAALYRAKTEGRNRLAAA